MTADVGGLIHTALFYRGDEEYLDAVVPFIRDGLDNGESVLVAVPTVKLALLRGALGDAAGDVTLADMADVGRNPARTFPMLSAFGRDRPGRARIVAEPIWAGRPAEAYPSCVQNEALFNTAFADRPFTTLCPYDVERLDDDVLADALMTHPTIQRGTAIVDSSEFDSWNAHARFNIALPVDPAAVTYPLHTLDDLSAARTFLTRYSESAGLPAEAVGDLQLIATELATNSLEYSGGGCTLALWQHDGDLICQVDDGGRLTDPLAGRRVPADHGTGGRGLFLVNALADLVRTHTCDTGTAIRAYLRLDRSP